MGVQFKLPNYSVYTALNTTLGFKVSVLHFQFENRLGSGIPHQGAANNIVILGGSVFLLLNHFLSETNLTAGKMFI